MIPTGKRLSGFFVRAENLFLKNSFRMKALQNTQTRETVTEFRKRDRKIAAVVILKMNGERADRFITSIGVLIACGKSDGGEFPIPQRDECADRFFDVGSAGKSFFGVWQGLRKIQKLIDTGNRVDGIDRGKQNDGEQ